MSGEVTPAEGVALGQEGTGQAVILNQPDFGAANYKLASLRLDEARRKKAEENAAIEGLQEYLTAPQNYFIPDTKEILDKHEERISFLGDSLRRKVDPRDPRNYKDFTKLSKLNAEISQMVNASNQAKAMVMEATKGFDPSKHDAQNFYDVVTDFTQPGIAERNKKQPNFLIGKSSPNDLWTFVPGGEIPETEDKARRVITQMFSTPEGQTLYAREANKPNGAWKTPQEAFDWELETWRGIRPPIKSTKTGGGGGSGSTKEKTPTLDYKYNLDYTKGGQGNTDPAKAYDGVDVFGVDAMPIKNWINPNAKKGEVATGETPVNFMPLSAQRDPVSGEIWFYGNVVPESKSEKSLMAGGKPDTDPDKVIPDATTGSLKTVSVPFKGNEATFQQMFKGTDMEDLNQFFDDKRSEFLGNASQNAGVEFATEVKTDPVDLDLQEKIYSNIPGVTGAAVKSGKVTLSNDKGVSKTFDIVKDATLLNQLAKKEITLNQLFLKSKMGNVEVLTNPDGSKISEAE